MNIELPHKFGDGDQSPYIIEITTISCGSAISYEGDYFLFAVSIDPQSIPLFVIHYTIKSSISVSIFALVTDGENYCKVTCGAINGHRKLPANTSILTRRQVHTAIDGYLNSLKV